MGVPGFYVWLAKKYDTEVKKIIVDSLGEKEIDTLYIDANCLFHPECFKILAHFTNLKGEALEKKMFKRIIVYINYLYTLVGAKNLYIAVDGVAPMAKMNQQRKRRFKSVITTEIENELKKKYNIKYNGSWTNVVITPGTKFMEKLHNYLLNFVSTFNKNKKEKVNIIYSSYHTPGEGEHKILQHIKTKPNGNNYVIYGLDADLFFLAIASKYDNIYLLREENHINNKTPKFDPEIDDIINDVNEEFLFVSIDNFKKCLNEHMLKNINKNTANIRQDEYGLCYDFVILCFLLGNDFLPHIPSIDIMNNGLDFLIREYTQVLNNGHANLINEKIINDDTFIELLASITGKEENYFQHIFPNFINRQKAKCVPDKLKGYEKELWEYRNLKNIEIQDPIQLGKSNPENYKTKYYRHYYKNCKQSFLFEMLNEYLKGIQWTMLYYFDKCPSYSWQYSHSHGPFISDVFNYVYTNDIKLNEYTFENEIMLDPLSQLLAVMPPQHKEYLPESYKKIMTQTKTKHLYPKTVTIDRINKTLEWKCDALVPAIDASIIKKETEKLLLTEEEKKRNLVLDEFYL